jgi:hypothetical protein
MLLLVIHHVMQAMQHLHGLVVGPDMYHHA